ncbi:MAG: translocation/assembly module TamB domain-containing protein [candidate division Zixibacteria bacterium]|nr:translocation/assembly module TamB domain-containing protein [candidate division Zixibacteria bacterium]
MKKRFKIPLYLVSFLLLACLIFWGLFTQTRLLENQVNRLLKVFVQSQYSLKVQVGDISGSLWRELIVKDLTVDFMQEGTEYRMAEIPYLKVNYQLSNLWRKKWILDSLTMDRPRFAITKTEDGKLLVVLPGTEDKVISKTGLFDFKIGNLKIKDGFLEYLSPEKRTNIDSLNLEISVTKDRDGTKINILRGDFTYPQKDFLLKSLEGFLWLKGDSLSIEELKIKTKDSEVEISGNVRNLQEPQFSFSVKAKPVNLEDIKKLTGVGLEGILDVEGTCQGNLKRFGGRATLNGLFFGRKFEQLKTQYTYQNKKFTFSSIRGKVFGSPLNGKGMFNFRKIPEEYEFEGQVKNLDLNNIVFGSLFTDFSGDIRMQGKSTSERELFMQAEINLQNGRIEQYSFNAAKGVMDITTNAVLFHPQFQLRYKNTGVALTGELQYNGEIDIDAWVNFMDLRDFWNQIFLKEMRGRGRAFVNISGKTEDFDIKGEFTSDSCYVYQLYSSDARVDLNIANFLTKQKGEVFVRFLDGEAWGVQYDSLISRIKIEDQLFKIDSAHLGNPYVGLEAWGELDISQTPQTLLIYEMSLDYRGNRLESFSPTVIDIDTHKVRIRKFVLSGKTGEIDVSGDIDYQERMDLAIKVSGLDIAPWAGLLSSEPIEGTLSLEAFLQGDFSSPQIDMKGEIQQLEFKGMELGHLKTDLSYKERQLEVKNLAVTDTDWEYNLSGFLPLDLSFVSVEQRVLEKPQNFRFSAKGKRLELIRLFIPDIEYLTGDFEGDLKISGSLLHPQFDGKMTLKDGSLKFVQLADPVEELVVEMRMKNENLILDKVSGFMEHGGREEDNLFKKMWKVFSPGKKVRGEVTGFGTINLKDIHSIEYDLYFSGDKVPINYEYTDLSAIADLSLEIAGKFPPLVTAQISFSELFYREPFSTSGSQASLPPSHKEEDLWDWSLDVSAANNCWIINDDVNLEFQGDVLVLREGGKLKILGNLETIRGKYFLYGTKFKIEKGSFFFDNVERIDPKIDFSVSTRLWGGSSASSGSGSLLSTGSTDEIKLAIGGTISEPEVKPAPGSPYSKEDVLGLLAFQRGIASVDSVGMGSLFQERVIKSLGGAYSSRFLENIAGQTLGVETFEIIPTWSEKFRLTDAQITIGKYISDKVYLRYTRRLSQSSGQETGVEYRLNKHLLLEGRKDKLGLFHFGLNLHWEY